MFHPWSKYQFTSPNVIESLGFYRDSEAGALVVDEPDVASQVPPRAAVHRSSRLAQVLELRHTPQVGGLHRTHGLDGRVGEQVLAPEKEKKKENTN